VLSLQSLVAPHIVQQLNFGRIIGGQEVSLWTSHDSSSLTSFLKTLVQGGCFNFNKEYLGGLAAFMLCSNALITLKIFPVTKLLAASISVPRKLPALKATFGKLQKLNSYTSDAMEFEAARMGRLWIILP